jgi:hypothetical protein
MTETREHLENAFAKRYYAAGEEDVWAAVAALIDAAEEMIPDEPNTCGGSMTGWLSRLAHHVRGHRVAVRQSTAAPLPVWVCACGERWAA